MATNENINDMLLNDVMAIYLDAEFKMMNNVAKRVAKGAQDTGWNEHKLSETKQLKAEIASLLNDSGAQVKSMVSKGIINAYKGGVASAVEDKTGHHTALDSLAIPQNLKMLVLATNNLLDNASFQVLRNSQDAYTEIMAKSTQGILAGTDTRIQASQKMLNEFAAKGITTFVDKSGRNWNLSSYAEMCARTVSSHAALQGHIDRSLDLGEDLVKVSSIGTTCPICARWQNVVLSITGKSNKYQSMDTAKSAGLFHPNCKHTVGMWIEALDGEGKIECNPVDKSDYSQQRNALIEQQRSNERNIRLWKKRKELAITPEEKAKAISKIGYWQNTNLLHCAKNDLRRQYAREGNMQAKNVMVTGGTTIDHEEFFKKVIGSDPKPLFHQLKYNLQYFGSDDVQYDKWLKEEVTSMDQLNVDMSYLKDKNNKEYTPTSMYKKYIGDNPGTDFAETTMYGKGTKEYKNAYSKWLVDQASEIGVGYKIKPKFKEIIEMVPYEDFGLSATVFYKKYHDGASPTVVFKELVNEGMVGKGDYAKWLTTSQKILIQTGIKKTVPYDNTTVQKAATVVVKAKVSIDDAKIAAYKLDLDQKVSGLYSGSAMVKKASVALEEAKSTGNVPDIDWAKKKYMIAKEYDIAINTKNAKTYSEEDLKSKINDVKKTWVTLVDANVPYSVIQHHEVKTKVWEDQLKFLQSEKNKINVDQMAAKIKLRAIQDAEIMKGGSSTFSTNDAVIKACRDMPRRGRSEIKDDLSNSFLDTVKQFDDSITLSNSKSKTKWDTSDHRQAADKGTTRIKPLQALHDYTSGSMPHNLAFKDNKSANQYFENRSRYTREQAQAVDKKLDKVFEAEKGLEYDTVLRHGNNADAIYSMLGVDDTDYDNFTTELFQDRLKAMNKNSLSGINQIVQEKGYLSCSPFSDEGFTSKTVELRILTHKGTKGTYVDSMAYYSGEYETLLKRNQTFRYVQGVYRDHSDSVMTQMYEAEREANTGSSGEYIIYMEAVPE